MGQARVPGGSISTEEILRTSQKPGWIGPLAEYSLPGVPPSMLEGGYRVLVRFGESDRFQYG